MTLVERFPTYSRAESATDGVVHLVGVPAAVVAAIWLIVSVGRSADAMVIVSLLIYGFGLIGMLATSAAYNLAPPSRAKALLRRADHAMIFVMIAGSYTPIALNVLPGRGGIELCATVWLFAIAGIALQLFYPRRFERVSLLLYLGMGWSLLSMIGSLIALTPHVVFLLLVVGGVVYSVGALIHSLRRLPFHNAIWHVLVLTGAGLHLAALRLQFGAPA